MSSNQVDMFFNMEGGVLYVICKYTIRYQVQVLGVPYSIISLMFGFQRLRRNPSHQLLSANLALAMEHHYIELF